MPVGDPQANLPLCCGRFFKYIVNQAFLGVDWDLAVGFSESNRAGLPVMNSRGRGAVFSHRAVEGSSCSHLNKRHQGR